MQEENAIIMQVEAALWNGKKRLPGKLILSPKNLFFHFDDFEKSHIKLEIPLKSIQQLESFLIYDLFRKGLKVTSRDGHYDLFVMGDLEVFLKKMRATLP